jgi:2-polyprenyl-6-methoxyphenol hydroxylase-like FAD-dependent oxidoreductase
VQWSVTRSGAAADAVNAQRRAVALRWELQDQRALGLSLRWLSRMLWFNGMRAGADKAAEEATAVLAEVGDDGLFAFALSNQSQLAMLAHRTEESAALARRAIALATAADATPVVSHALTNLGLARWMSGDRGGFDDLNEAVRVALSIDDVEDACRAYVGIVSSLLDEFRLDEAEPFMIEALALAEQAEFIGFLAYLQACRGRLELARGRWEAAVAVAELPQRSQPAARCAALTVLGTVRLRLGQPGATELLAEAQRLAEQMDELKRIGPVAAARCEHAALRGDWAAVVEIAEPVFALAVHLGDQYLQAELAYRPAYTRRRVVIVGGGVAGLSLARALKNADHPPLVIERSPEWPATGTADYLPANAARALDRLGIGDDVAAAAHPISRQLVTGTRGRTLVDLPVSSIWGEDASCVAMRRSTLHKLLQAATCDVPARLGTSIAARLRGHMIKLSDGSVEPYDVLVGADGVDSVVRTAGISGTEPRPTGRWCWQFIAEGWDGDDDTWHARLAAGRSMVTMPLGDGAVYCYADLSAGNGRPSGDWRNYFSGFGQQIDGLLAQAGHVYGTPITEVDQPYAFLGRTVLVGDAAHAMSPSMAQGVALAVEDGLVLAETLSSLPIEEAMSAYQERRVPRIAWVRAQAHRRDSTRGLTPAVRDKLLRLAGRRVALAGQPELPAIP